MEGIPALLLLLILKLYPGGGPAPTLAKECPGADIVLKEGDKKVIVYIDRPDDPTFHSSGRYVRPVQGFQGLRLNVTGTDGKQYEASFPADGECFPTNGQWYKIFLKAEVLSGTNTLIFSFTNGKCKRECERTNSTERFQNFSVVASGASSWIEKQYKHPCNAIGVKEYRQSHTRPACTSGPLPEVVDPSSSLGGMTIIVIVVAAILLFAVMVLVVVKVLGAVRRRAQRRQQQI